MRAYVMATGICFALLVIVHIWRAVEERNLATDPGFILITLTAAALSVSAWYVLRRDTRAKRHTTSSPG